MFWYDEPTVEEIWTKRQAVNKIFKKYKTSIQVTHALQIITQKHIAYESVLAYLKNVEVKPIPIYWAASLSDLVDDVDLKDFYPWLNVYFEPHYD